MADNNNEQKPDTTKQKQKKMKLAARVLSTHSDPTQMSAISIAQHKAFGKLNLDEVTPEDSKKARTHVNPLAKQFMEPTPPPPDWKEWFDDPTKPLGIDVGCAAGRFGILMITNEDGKVPEHFRGLNHLGLEIRKPLVDRANAWVEGKGLSKQIRYLVSNANVSLSVLLKTYPGDIRFIAVQFPDPHFKKKHHKRRVVNEAFLKTVCEVLSDNGYFFVQSDVEEAAAQMRDRTDAFSEWLGRDGEYTPRDSLLIANRVRSGEGEDYWTQDGKKPAGGDYGDWRIGPNPMGVPTEREVQNEAINHPIYRALYTRKPR